MKITRNPLKQLKMQNRKKYLSEDFPQYHLDILEEIDKTYSLKGKTIIDIGGSNIPIEIMKSFGVKKFVCVDPISKWGYYQKDNVCFGKRIYKETEFSNAFENEYSFIIDNEVETLGEQFNNIFDIAISISTFEHVNSIKETLNVIHRMLKSKGVIISQYEPVFSCASGHHVYVSKEYNFNNMPEIDYLHLLYKEDEAREYIKSIERFDKNIQEEIIRQAYHSNVINRFMIKDHIVGFHNSLFNKFIVEYFYMQPVPEEIRQKLVTNYGDQRYDIRGIKYIGIK